jgi:hypothetical protein
MEKGDKLNVAQSLMLLQERYTNLDGQMRRFFAHVESEQRHFKTQGDLIKSIEHNMSLQTQLLNQAIAQNTKELEVIRKLYEKHEQILINGGSGIVFDVKHMKAQGLDHKNRMAFGVSVGAAIVSLIGVALRVFFKT